MKKKVTFNDNVQVHVIPREPGCGTWVTDKSRFMQRVHELERLFKTYQITSTPNPKQV